MSITIVLSTDFMQNNEKAKCQPFPI